MKKFIGPIIFVLIAVVVALWYRVGDIRLIEKAKPPEMVTVEAFVGGEKIPFLHNPEVNHILEHRYGIRLNAVKAGSIEMVTSLSPRGKDALWPSNRIAVSLFKNQGGQYLAEENIFNSPIVFHTFALVAKALEDHHYISSRDNILYATDMDGLMRTIQAGQEWKDIGLPQLYGRIAIASTDPKLSNSGNIFAGLLANLFNGGHVVTEPALNQVLPRLVTYFSQRGYMEHSSGDIFRTFINTGPGSKPIIVGYENQLVEFALKNEKYLDYLKEKIRVIYPVPTIWSSHPLMALTPNGKRLINALKDDEIQAMAWERHGFRSGLIGIENDPEVLKVTGIPKEITAVIAMPDARVMEMIIQSL